MFFILFLHIQTESSYFTSTLWFQAKLHTHTLTDIYIYIIFGFFLSKQILLNNYRNTRCLPITLHSAYHCMYIFLQKIKMIKVDRIYRGEDDEKFLDFYKSNGS